MKILNFLNTYQDWENLLAESPYFVSTKWDGDYFILKYNQIKSNFNNEIVRECRGSIFKKTDKGYKCVCMPFFKFGNYGESYVEPIDWDTASVQEKVDGSLIKLWYDGEWHWSTNGTINAQNAPIVETEYQNFYDLIKLAVKDDFSFLDELDLNVCYMFELVSPYSKVVVPYKDTALYLIGARKMTTFTEYDHKDLYFLWKGIFKYFGIKLPKRYPLRDLSSCIDCALHMNKNEEGFVVVDKYFNRVKIKSQQWLIASKLKGNDVPNEVKILEMIKNGTFDDFISYFPEYEVFAQKVLKKFTDCASLLDKKLVEYPYNELLPRAEYAKMIAKENPLVISFLFAQLKNPMNGQEYLFAKSAKKCSQIMEGLNE